MRGRETCVGTVRQRFFAPRVKAKSHEELDAWLEDRCTAWAKAHRHPRAPGGDDLGGDDLGGDDLGGDDLGATISRPSDRASWRIAGPSRQRREPSCGAPAVRFAPEARALLWRTCGALRARGASPLVAHLRCASRQRREPSCGAPAVRRLACRAGRGVEDLPRPLRQQHVLGLCLRGRASRRGPRPRRPRRGPPGRPGHRPSIGVPSGAAGRSTTPGDCGARARSQAGRARGAARPSRAGSCRTRSSASAASFAAWPMATGRWSRSSAPCGATGFPPSRRPAPRPSACGVHSADVILNILARRCAGRAPAVRPRAVAARHAHDPRGGSRLAHDPRGGSRLAHEAARASLMRRLAPRS